MFQSPFSSNVPSIDADAEVIFVADYFYFIPLTLDQKLTDENANENEFRNTALGTA